MINSNLLNGGVFNGMDIGSIDFSVNLSKKISFNGYILNDCETKKILVEDTNIEDLMDVELDELEYSDGFGEVTQKKFRKKIINMTLAVFCDSQEELILKIREIKRNIQGINGKLYYNQFDRTQYVVATCVGVDLPDNYQTDSTITKELNGGIVLSFKTYTPFINDEKDNIDVFDISTTTHRLIFNNDGDFEVDVRYVLQCSVCATTGVSINLNGNIVSYIGAISDGDVLIIDGKKGEFKINGESKDFSGVIEDLKINGNDVTIIFDTSNPIEYDLSVSFNQKFH